MGGAKRPSKEAAKSHAVFAVTEKGLRLAERLKVRYPSMELFGPADVKGGRLFAAVKKAFSRFDALIFITATGIAVRAIAPLLKGKHLDPAVVVMDEGGRFVISLVSGHLGGANDLSRELAAATGATPVITTATDVAGLPCAEDIAKEFGLVIEDVKSIKTVNSAILAGGPVAIVDSDPGRLKAIRGFLTRFNANRLFSFSRTMTGKARARAVVYVTSRLAPTLPAGCKPKTMLLRPREFVAGVGCRRGVGKRAIALAVKEAFTGAGLSTLSLARLATIDIKHDEAGITRYALEAGVGVEYFTAERLNTIRPPSGPSRAAIQATGAAGVSEPAALISSGAKRLWVRKIKKGNVTVALARAPFTS